MRVLLAFDGSPCAHSALRMVAGLRWPASTRVPLVSVIDHPDVIGAGEAAIVWAAREQSDQDLAASAQRLLHDAAAELLSAGRQVDTRLERGRPASRIVELAAELAIDLVVVGSRGLGPWSSLLLGSVSTEVVDHAPCPVLVARNDRVNRLVVATDGSMSAQRAVDALIAWGLFRGLPAFALSVRTEPTTDWAVALAGGWVDGYPYTDDTDADDHQRLAAMVADLLRDAGIDAQPIVRCGDAAQQIADVAKAEGDLLVMGSRGFGTLQRLVLGSVARKVLRHSHASILIVREPRTTSPARTRATSLAAFAV